MSINERLIHTASDATSGSGNQEEGLILHLDANDVDSYDGTGSVWYDISDHEFTPSINPEEQFNTVLYTGNGSASGQSVTGVGFQPDLTILKSRVTLSNGTGGSWMWFDSLRGPSNWNRTDSSAMADATSNGLASFDADGFTTDNGYIYSNQNGRNYVAYNFKAGGAPTATNTATSGAMTANSVSIDGQLQSSWTPGGYPEIYPDKLSVNTKFGFSVVKWTGKGANGNTIPHGLGVPPELIITKRSDLNKNWYAGTTYGFGWTHFLQPNTNQAQTDSDYFDDTAPDGNVWSVYDGEAATVNPNGAAMISYCFASKRGVSKVGSYTGTGASGNKVYTGFEPAFVMFKNTSSTGNWIMHDNKRDTTNPRAPHLRANTSGAEDSGSNEQVDFNGDGFTLKSGGQNANYSGHTYIYLAFAKSTNETELATTTPNLHLDAASYSGSGYTWTADVGSDGTITGATYDEELGDSFHFDGVDDKVDCGASVVKQNDMSVEMWVNFDNVVSTHGIFSNYSTTDGNKGFSIRLTSSGHIQVDGYGTGGVANRLFREFNSGLLAGRWYHIVVIVEAGTATCYVDGESIAQVNDSNYNKHNGTVQYTAATTTRLGLSYEGSQYLDGRLGQVRIYDSILTQENIRQNYNYTKPSYPNGINGTLVGPSWNPSGYFDFNGTSDYVTFNYSKWHDNFTVSFWAYFDDLSLGKIFDKTTWYASSHQAFPFAISANNGTVTASISYGNDYSFDVNVSGSYTTGKWYHILVTAEHGDKLKIWSTAEDGTFNSTPSQEAAYTGTVNGSGNNNYTLGRASSVYGGGVGQDSFFDGRISKLKMFDKVLSESEISAQFNEGA